VTNVHVDMKKTLKYNRDRRSCGLFLDCLALKDGTDRLFRNAV
jgi:hypothetical protein